MNKKVEALNKLTREVHKALPRLKEKTNNKTVMSIIALESLDLLEVKIAARELIKTIIEEKG